MKKTGLLMLVGIVMAVGAAALFSGCANRSANIVSGVAVAEGADLPYSYIINNKKLADRVEVVRLDARTVDGIAQAQITVLNNTKKSQRFEYWVQWFDKDGFAISSAVQSWQPVLIYGRMEKTLLATAPSEDAVRYRVAFKMPEELWEHDL